MKESDLKFLREKISRCKSLTFKDIDLSKVKDISEIKISRKKSSRDRILDFLNSTENPYMYKVGGVLVKVEFSKKGKTAEECITNVIKSIYK